MVGSSGNREKRKRKKIFIDHHDVLAPSVIDKEEMK